MQSVVGSGGSIRGALTLKRALRKKKQNARETEGRIKAEWELGAISRERETKTDAHAVEAEFLVPVKPSWG